MKTIILAAAMIVLFTLMRYVLVGILPWPWPSVIFAAVAGVSFLFLYLKKSKKPVAPPVAPVDEK